VSRPERGSSLIVADKSKDALTPGDESVGHTAPLPPLHRPRTDMVNHVSSQGARLGARVVPLRNKRFHPRHLLADTETLPDGSGQSHQADCGIGGVEPRLLGRG
jgi:hypothetical protein